MAQLEQRVLDFADGRQAEEGDGANGRVNYVAVPQDLQNMKLVIDIGDNRSIEIPLRGNLILQNSSGPPPGAATAAAQGQSEQDNEDMKSLENMRGWLMTVAALFVGIAFQAKLQPPGWMPKDWAGVLFSKKHASLSPSHLEDASDTITTGQAVKALVYVFANTAIFAESLTLLVILVVRRNSWVSANMTSVKALVALMAFSVAYNFAWSTSDDLRAVALVMSLPVVYAAVTIHFIRSGLEFFFK